jgi:glycine cleavage system H protein
MAATDVKDDRKYTKDHEWALDKNGELVVGITAFAVDQLGDVTLVNIDVKAGETVSAGKAFGTIESVKTLSDLYCPVSGKVVAVNAVLEEKPEVINEDPWGEGWMIVIAPSAGSGELMDSAAYSAFLKESAH